MPDKPFCDPDKYSMLCIAAAALNAGMTDLPTLIRATAVGYAESSGRTKVVNSNGCCVGLWQINTQVHKQYSTAQMKDPAANAAAMWAISNHGANWRPWEAFTTNAYMLYVPAATKAVNELNSKFSAGIDNNPLVPDSIERPYEGAVDSAGGLLAFGDKITAWTTDRKNIMRIAKVIIGGAVAIVGVSILAKPLLSNAANVAGAVIPAGKAATVAKAVVAKPGVAAPSAPAPSAPRALPRDFDPDGWKYIPTNNS